VCLERGSSSWTSTARRDELRDGERPAAVFRDVKGQIEQAASGCGFTFA